MSTIANSRDKSGNGAYRYSLDPTASTTFSELVSHLPLLRATEVES